MGNNNLFFPVEIRTCENHAMGEESVCNSKQREKSFIGKNL